jgi:hypothetical protein
MQEADVKRLVIATFGTAVLALGCSGGTPSSAVSTSAEFSPAPVDQGVLSGTPSPASSAPVPARRRERVAPEVASIEKPETSNNPTAAVRAVPEYREVTLPAGTALALRLSSDVASDTSQVEDAVQATLREDVTLDGGAVLPAGTELVGRVTDVERSGRVKGRARVAFRFTMLRHDDDEYDVRSEAIERMAEATKGEDATKIGIGAGAGAVLGAVLGGGSGAAKGAAIGAAAGTGAVLATRGEEVRLAIGDPVDTRLTAPLPVRIRLRR